MELEPSPDLALCILLETRPPRPQECKQLIDLRAVVSNWWPSKWLYLTCTVPFKCFNSLYAFNNQILPLQILISGLP